VAPWAFPLFRITLAFQAKQMPYLMTIHLITQTAELACQFSADRIFKRMSALQHFYIRADVNVLTTLCDQAFNVVPSCPYRYVPLTSNVMLVYADMLVASLDERDAQVGFIPETEVGFWVLTVAMQKTSNGEVPHHLAWFLPTLIGE
jgi:hypothetical protein